MIRGMSAGDSVSKEDGEGRDDAISGVMKRSSDLPGLVLRSRRKRERGKR